VLGAMFKGKKIKKPSDLVKFAKQMLQAVDKNPKEREKNMDELSKFVSAIKQVLYGDEEHPLSPENASQVVAEIYTSELLPMLCSNVVALEFETKKDATAVLAYMLKRTQPQPPTAPTIDWIVKSAPTLPGTLVLGYTQDAPTALASGAMLRECLRYEELARLLLAHEESWQPFFAHIDLPTFDVASDAFATFRELLTKHKGIVAEFLEAHYDRFFGAYTVLLQSQNYVTKRQSLKLLGELLLDRSNFNVMTRYIAASTNLKLMMTLLTDKSRSIQFEAFHVFKVFVANPNKPAAVLEILQKNKEKLVGYLAEFHNDKDDEQFTDEKAYLLRQIEAL